MTQVLCDPIGTVVGGRGDVVDDDWGDVTSLIRLGGRFSPESLSGLDGFSHVEVVFFLDRVPVDRSETGAPPPRPH